ncbi:diphthine--ammonia ligase [Candidatus Woesearchaeota archaeon]|nr:diphthine--ammonia ligase [Candidatus Woesearchaeota archaeon]
MKVGILTSGGKDSLYAAYLASKTHELTCLISMKSENPESYMFHVPNVDLVGLQAKAMELPLVFESTKGEKEKELEDLKRALLTAKEKYEIKGIVSGAIASVYQKSRIEKLCKKLDLASLTPLWGMDQEKYMEELLKNKFEFIIVGIAAHGLTTKEFLGKIIDEDLLRRLKEVKEKYNINLSGEGGEFESLVLNCSLFKKRLVIKKAVRDIEKETIGHYIIKKAELL